MKRFLLDTNVVSELRKPKPHGAVVAWLSRAGDDQLFLSAVTMGELQAGIERTRAQDAKKAQEIESWVDQLADSIQVLPMDALCFRMGAAHEREVGRFSRRCHDRRDCPGPRPHSGHPQRTRFHGAWRGAAESVRGK